MSLKETYKQMRDLLTNVTSDLEKAEGGNKAASQRVRTGTVKLEKLAKLYRKESIASEKKTKGQKKTTKTAAAAAGKSKSSTPSKGKTQSNTTSNIAPKSKDSKLKTKSKTAAKASVRPRQLSLKRATAKLPVRRAN